MNRSLAAKNDLATRQRIEAGILEASKNGFNYRHVSPDVRVIVASIPLERKPLQTGDQDAYEKRLARQFVSLSRCRDRSPLHKGRRVLQG